MRFASYNVQYGTGKDGHVDLDRIAAEIGEADVVALQEVDCFFERSGIMDQAEGFARLFPQHFWIFGAGLDVHSGERDANRRRRFGNMLLARWPILSSRNHLLPKDGLLEQMSVQRSALEGVVAIPGAPIRVYSVHLGHASSAERVRQAKRLRDILRDAAGALGVISGRDVKAEWLSGGDVPPMPNTAIVMGDFNMTASSPEYEVLCGENSPRDRLATAAHLIDTWVAAGNDAGDGVTFIRHGEPVRIDYVFVTPDLGGRIRAAAIGADAEGSDHQPVFADLALD